MAKKFSLETVLSLTDGITGPINKAQTKMIGFSKTIKKHFGGLGKDITAVSKQIDKVAIAFGLAASAGVAASVALIQSTAQSADAFIKQARIIGITSEQLQALTYAADLQGVSVETLNGSLEKMMKNVGELRNGEGSLGKYLASTDRSLLRQIQSASSSEEIFTLLMGKLGGMTDEFARAQFAQLAFGKSGIDMIKMANGGADAISALLSEAHQYGLVSDSASESSEVFLDEQARLKAMLLGMKNQVFNALIPKLADVATGIREMLLSAEPGASIIDKLKAAIEGIDTAKVIADLKAFGEWIKNTANGIMRFIDIAAPLIPYLLTLAATIKTVAVALAIYNAIEKANATTTIIMAIITGVGLLITAIQWLKNNFESLPKPVQDAFIMMKEGAIGFGATILDFILTPLELVLRAVSLLPGMGNKFGGILGFIDKINEKSLFGQIGAAAISGAQMASSSQQATYAEPSTFASESRSYSESRTTSEVFVRPDRGATISPTRGGAPAGSLSYGTLQ